MIAFPEILTRIADVVGMKAPENCDEYDKEEFPHLCV